MNSPHQICVWYVFVYQNLKTFEIMGVLWVHKGYFEVKKFVINVDVKASGVQIILTIIMKVYSILNIYLWSYITF